MISLDKLFIGEAGYVTRKDSNTINFNNTGFVIAKEKTYSTNEYTNIFTKTKYTSFHSTFCTSGDNAILNPIELTLFVQKHYKYFKQFDDNLEKIANKIINKKTISEANLKTLLFAINNKDEFSKPRKKSSSNIKIYTDLSKKKYELSPCYGRKDEFSKLIFALPEEKSNPILIGDHGVGKTTIIDGLAYKIHKKVVPDFLRKQKIFELDITNLNAYNENLEDKLINLIAYCIKNNIILFIDDIEKLYEYEIYDIIKVAIKRKNLKVIGTTTIENYNKYFSNDDFTKILIEEPNYKDLNEIIRSVIDNYAITTNVMIMLNMDNIIDILIDLTKKENRIIDTNNKIPDEKSANPYLVIQIIDKMFAHAIANEQTQLSIENVIYAINSCDKIYDNIREEYMKNINRILMDKTMEQYKLIRKGL